MTWSSVIKSIGTLNFHRKKVFLCTHCYMLLTEWWIITHYFQLTIDSLTWPLQTQRKIWMSYGFFFPAKNIGMYTKIFLKKLSYKFLFLIFTLLLASFAPKSVNYSRHSNPLKYLWKSTNHRRRRKMSSISEFFWMFKDSLCREWLTNLDAKGAKRSVKMWIKNFYISFFLKLLYMNSGLSKIRSVCYDPDGLFWLNMYVVVMMCLF